MMGPSHALSGAAFWLTGVGVYSTVTGTPVSIPITIMGTAIAAGAAIAPDLDSYSSTAVKSFGIFGRILYYIVNALSLFVYNLTRARGDEHKDNGHRTLMHTGAMGFVSGGLVALATIATGKLMIFDHEYTWGQFFGLIIMGIFLNFALLGLFGQFRSMGKKFGPYLMLAVSVLATFAIAAFIPEANNSYSWLGIAVAAGWFTHLWGDSITKMGIPLLWPIKIRNKRWYNMGSPQFMRFSAGSAFESKLMVPLFGAMTIASGAWVGYLAFSPMVLASPLFS
jgi:hypothetical protein